MADHLVLVRHGETEWSKSGQHTSYTDLPLLPQGIEDAKKAGDRLSQWNFTKVFSSPRQRAAVTAQLALATEDIELTEDLAEWNYGDYEGITTPKIHETDPNWWLWRDGGPNGDSAADVADRCDRFINRVSIIEGDVAAFAHSHILRSLAARWVGRPVDFGSSFVLDTSGVSVLTTDRGNRVIKRWNLK